MINFPKVLNFREVFNKPMSGGKTAQVEVRLIQDLLSGFTYPFTNDNKCLQRDPADFVKILNIFMIFYHRDYLSHKMEIYAIR